MSYETMPVLFPTLRVAGYQHCAHPRVDVEACMDCGATRRLGVWTNSNLDFLRQPLRCFGPGTTR